MKKNRINCSTPIDFQLGIVWRLLNFIHKLRDLFIMYIWKGVTVFFFLFASIVYFVYFHFVGELVQLNFASFHINM